MNADVSKLLSEVLRVSSHTITTDWISYCLDKSVNIEVLDDKTVVVEKLIKDGIPAVNTLFLIDNNFSNSRPIDWKRSYCLLCRNEFVICIEQIKDVKVSSEDKVQIHKRQIFLKFNDPN